MTPTPPDSEQLLRLLGERAGDDLRYVVSSARMIENATRRKVTRAYLTICEQTIRAIRDRHFPEEPT